MYVAKTTREERERAETARILLSSWTMSKEGLDIPALDTLVMCSPKADVEQGVGRILRRREGKGEPWVLDVVDPTSIFMRLHRKRNSFYTSQGYSPETESL